MTNPITTSAAAEIAADVAAQMERHITADPPPNAERLLGLDRSNMEDAFIHLFAIHERHKKGGIYLCSACPLCDQAICAYSALVAMCQATGVNIVEIKNLLSTPGQEADHG